MKRRAIKWYMSIILMGILVFAVSTANAKKARGINDGTLAFQHVTHLYGHLMEETCHGTGNYLKVRIDAAPSKVLGHLEQADRFILLELQNGYAKVQVTYSDQTSPDSFIGLSGWVDANYIDCNCSDEEYYQYHRIAFSGENVFVDDVAQGYLFCSGAGAWSTELFLKPDGSFIGYYHDTDMGDTGDAYPNGIQYFCNFSGQFGKVHKINDYTYEMQLVKMNIRKEKSHIEDEVYYIASEPYGFEEGKDYLLYLPNAPVSELSEEFLSWTSWMWEQPPTETLGCYGIYNCKKKYGFFGF